MPTDSDADGFPDFQELDSDDDGLSDIQESGGIDANGDGAADSLVDANLIPDADGDGTPDFQEIDGDITIAPVPNAPAEPVPNAPAEPERNVPAQPVGNSGEIITGLEGSGCSISLELLSSGHYSLDFKRVDPMLPMLSVLALAGLAVRRRKSPDSVTAKPVKSGKAKSIATATATATAAALLASTSVNSSEVPHSVPVAIPDFNPALVEESMYEPANETVQESVPVAMPEPDRQNNIVEQQAHSVQTQPIFEPLPADALIVSRGDNNSRSAPVADVPAVSSFASEDRLSRGLYAVAGIGPSFMEPDTTQVDGWDPNDRVEPAGQITIGADLTKHLSIEAHSADLGSAGLSAPEPGREGRINYHVNGVSALVYVGGNRHRFRRQGLTAFGRVGYGELENRAIGDVPFRQENSNHVLFGAGVEYMTSKGFGVRAEGVSFDADARYAQLGLMYRTGRRQEREQPGLAAATPLTDPCVAISGILNGVNFNTDSADLTDESMLILNDVSDTLGRCGQKQVKVTAHTDSIGTEDYNKTLSTKRAVSVVKYLVEQGVQLDRFEARAFGETQPVASNDTVEGRSRNRRVELYAR